MTVQAFLEGGRVRVVATITDDDDQPANPTGATFTILFPDGTTDSYTWPGPDVQNPAVGELRMNVDVDQPGRHKVHFQAAGSVRAAAEFMFRVEESHVV